MTRHERAIALVMVTERTLNELVARRERLEREIVALLDDEATWADLGRRAVRLLAREIDDRRRARAIVEPL